jgi:CheY-like chemotaxis protein
MVPVTDMGSGKVLLVEGDPAALGLLSRGLTRFGLSVEGVTDADRAIDAATAARPDVVVTEVSEGSDLRLLERLRLLPQTQDVPVLLLTKGAWARRRSQLRDLGAQELLAKPAFVQDVAVLSWLHAGSRAWEERFRGELGDASCAVLLRGLLAGGRSGELTLAPLGGRIAFREGAVVDARLAPLSGERALLRLLALDAKSYELSFRPFEGAAKMTVELPELTGRGFEHVRRFGALRRELPPLDALLSQDFRALSGALDALSPSLRAVLRLFDGRRRLMEVLDDSPFDDVTTAATVVQLTALGLLSQPERATKLPPSEPELDIVEGEPPPLAPQAVEEGAAQTLAPVAPPPEAYAEATPAVSRPEEPPLAAPPPSPAEMDVEDAFFKGAVVGDAGSRTVLENPAMRRALVALAVVSLGVAAIAVYQGRRPKAAPEVPAEAKAELVDAPANEPPSDTIVAAPLPSAPAEGAAAIDEDEANRLVAEGKSAYEAHAFKTALAKLQAAVKAAPENSDAQLYLGATQFELGRFPAAKAALAKALALDKSNAQAELFLGTIAQEEGHKADARAHYAAYLRLSPGGEHASEVRSVLRTLNERQ